MMVQCEKSEAESGHFVAEESTRHESAFATGADQSAFLACVAANIGPPHFRVAIDVAGGLFEQPATADFSVAQQPGVHFKGDSCGR
jgi:hypothetical protein